MVAAIALDPRLVNGAVNVVKSKIVNNDFIKFLLVKFVNLSWIQLQSVVFLKHLSKFPYNSFTVTRNPFPERIYGKNKVFSVELI